MGEFGRILTNLGLAAGLMNKDQFIEKVAEYASERDLSEEKMKALIENVFEEIEITYNRRKANQMYEAYKKERVSRNKKSSDFFSEFEEGMGGAQYNDELLFEMRNLRQAIENLTDAVTNNKPQE